MAYHIIKRNKRNSTLPFYNNCLVIADARADENPDLMVLWQGKQKKLYYYVVLSCVL